jgi:uncharacterized protein
MIQNSPIHNIDLFITERCNLNCSYCFHPKNDVVLTEEEGKKILDRLKELYPERMSITFFGGEPLLFPELVLKLAIYARTLWEKSEFNVSTNGTYFDEEMFKKFKELSFKFQVSIDGIEEVNNITRGGDFKLICSNAKKILSMFPDSSVRMTVTPENIKQLMLGIEFLHRQIGFIKIMYHIAIEVKWTPDAMQIYGNQIEQLYKYNKICIRGDAPLEVMSIEKTFHLINGTAGYDKNFCGAGKTYVGILSNGDVYPCHRAASSRTFKLGNIFEEIPIIRGRFATLSKDSIASCRNCPSAGTCHACVITNHKVNGDLTSVCSSLCSSCYIEYDIAKMHYQEIVSEKANQKIRHLQRSVDELTDIIGKVFYLVKGESK